MKSYHFRILRYVHDVSTEEFVNIGVVMWMPEYSQLIFRLNTRFGRLSRFFTNFDGDGYYQMVHNLQHAFGEIAINLQQLNLLKANPKSTSEIFNELVREDDSCFQWSPLMYGVTANPREQLGELFEEFVTFHEPPGRRRLPRPRNERMIWKTVHQALKAHHLESHVELGFTMKSTSYEHSFRLGWNNGIRQVLEPISLGLRKPEQIIDKAHIWSGRLLNLSTDNEFGCTAVLAPWDEYVDRTAFNRGLEILKDAPSMREVITENDVNDYMFEIENDLGIEKLGIFPSP